MKLMCKNCHTESDYSDSDYVVRRVIKCKKCFATIPNPNYN